MALLAEIKNAEALLAEIKNAVVLLAEIKNAVALLAEIQNVQEGREKAGDIKEVAGHQARSATTTREVRGGNCTERKAYQAGGEGREEK